MNSAASDNLNYSQQKSNIFATISCNKKRACFMILKGDILKKIVRLRSGGLYISEQDNFGSGCGMEGTFPNQHIFAVSNP
jgi:hypothetical protein